MTTKYDRTGKQTWVLQKRGHVFQLYDTLADARDDNPQWDRPEYAWEEVEENGFRMGALMFNVPSGVRWFDTEERLYRHS